MDQFGFSALYVLRFKKILCLSFRISCNCACSFSLQTAFSLVLLSFFLFSLLLLSFFLFLQLLLLMLLLSLLLLMLSLVWADVMTIFVVVETLLGNGLLLEFVFDCLFSAVYPLVDLLVQNFPFPIKKLSLLIQLYSLCFQN